MPFLNVRFLSVIFVTKSPALKFQKIKRELIHVSFLLYGINCLLPWFNIFIDIL